MSSAEKTINTNDYTIPNSQHHAAQKTGGWMDVFLHMWLAVNSSSCLWGMWGKCTLMVEREPHLSHMWHAVVLGDTDRQLDAPCSAGQNPACHMCRQAAPQLPVCGKWVVDTAESLHLNIQIDVKQFLGHKFNFAIYIMATIPSDAVADWPRQEFSFPDSPL